MIAVLISLPFSFEHFIPTLDDCFWADICNHTNIPECGRENNDIQLFSDECHRYEHNCDNKRDYAKVDISECTATSTTTLSTTTSPSTTVSTITASESTTTATEKPTTTTTEASTTTSTSTTTQTTTTLSTSPSTTESTSQTTTPLTSTANILSTTTTSEPTISTLISTTVPLHHDCSRTSPPEVVTICSHSPSSTTTTVSTSISTPETTSSSPTTESSSVTTSSSTTVSTIISTLESSSSETESTSISTASTTPSVPTTTTVSVSTIVPETTNPNVTTPLNISQPAQSDINENTIPQNSVTPEPVPKQKPCGKEGCENLPTSWETTVKGETRDFFQILRERYGAKNVLLMRATTHWPRRVGWMGNGREGKSSFVFGKHVDSKSNDV